MRCWGISAKVDAVQGTEESKQLQPRTLETSAQISWDFVS